MSQLIGPLQGMAHMLIEGGQPAISSTPWLNAGPSMAFSFLQGRPDTPTMTALMHSIFADDGDDDALVAPLAIEDAEEDMALPEALAEQAEVAAEAAEVAVAAASDALLMETPGGQGHPMGCALCPIVVAELALLLPAILTPRDAANYQGLLQKHIRNPSGKPALLLPHVIMKLPTSVVSISKQKAIDQNWA